MRDVAQRAGVSVSTVSHVVNNTRAVSADARAQVQQAMAALGYKPNALARSLRRQKTHSIGMIVPDNANPFFAEIARAIEDIGFARSYSIILCNSDGNLEKQAAYVDLLIERRVAGILFVAAGVSTEVVADLQRRRMPLVVIDRAVPGAAVDRVQTNHYQGGQLATQHLIELGHRRIACIAAGSDLSPSAERVTGYRDTLAAHGLAYDPDLVAPGDFQFASGYRAAQQLLDLPQPPTAVFACNDLMAVGCISAATARGLRVPQDLAVVGFDDVKLASFTNPPLTTVAQPKREIGRLAMEMLLARMRDPDAPPHSVRLDTRLVIRQSSGAPAASGG
jgi:LacI family transcriptional regulator